MNLNLYQISNEYQKLLSQLYDHETGEVNMEVDAQITALSDAADKKCIAIASFIKKMEAEKREIEFVKDEICRRETAYNKEINKLNNYLQTNMENFGVTEIKTPHFTLKIKKNPYSTEILDESIIPENFMHKREIVKTEIKPDKNAIKDSFIQTGIQIPGTCVQQTKKLQILIDKI